MESIDKRKQLKERFFWVSITMGLLCLVLFLSLTPNLIAQNSSNDSKKALEKFTEIYYYIQQYYVDEEKTEVNALIDGALKGMFKALDDPFSAYLTPEELHYLTDTSQGSFGGVGLVISKKRPATENQGERTENTPVEVISPIEGTPAYKAGVTAGDLIIKVDGESTYELSLDEVVRRLRGKPGTDVSMTLQRGNSLVFDVTVTRAVIEIPTVKSAVMPQGIGYLKIIEFTSYTVDRVKEVLLDFKKQNYKGLIVDLRSNPGGLLPSVVSVSDFFLSQGPIVSVKARAASDNVVYNATPYKTIVPENIPVVVLIDRGSASAAEILAGALQDTGRALIIGETSYGKGTVQHAKVMGDSGFRLTVAKYYTPKGISIDKVGVKPDVEVKEEEYSEAEKTSYEKLIKENTITNFVKAHPHANEKAIDDFITTLKKQGIALRELALKRLIKNEMNRTNNNPPVYDVSIDPVLEKAVAIILER
ncbi:MAG: S41 family peptidase [Spirochaetales bacterium]|nr:S41 family peptidase [Spirochaetales bacterium]